jgi:hypothetical protein
MAARTGLSDLILQLRGFADAGNADYTQTGGTAVYWDDVQLQIALDRHVSRVYREQLMMYPTIIANGVPLWQEYRSAYLNWERIDSGTAIFNLEDGAGNTPGTALWTADYALGVITFGVSTGGSIYFVTGRSYDLYGAAADVWRAKAGQAAKAYDVSTDNHRLSRSQMMDHCLKMADYYAGFQHATVTQMYRSDSFVDGPPGADLGPIRKRDRSGEGGW